MCGNRTQVQVFYTHIATQNDWTMGLAILSVTITLTTKSHWSFQNQEKNPDSWPPVIHSSPANSCTTYWPLSNRYFTQKIAVTLLPRAVEVCPRNLKVPQDSSLAGKPGKGPLWLHKLTFAFLVFSFKTLLIEIHATDAPQNTSVSHFGHCSCCTLAALKIGERLLQETLKQE